MDKAVTKKSKGSETGKEIQAVRPTRALGPSDEVFRMFENMFPRGWLQPFRRDWPLWGELTAPLEARIPKVDIIDRDEELVVRAEIPGVEKNDLDISVSDDSVTIKGESKHEEKEEKGNYYRCEISRGAFTRTVALPNYVNSDGAKAKFKDGVLELILPKAEKAKRRSITVD